jgi:hypothetical protein
MDNTNNPYTRYLSSALNGFNQGAFGGGQRKDILTSPPQMQQQMQPALQGIGVGIGAAIRNQQKKKKKKPFQMDTPMPSDPNADSDSGVASSYDV